MDSLYFVKGTLAARCPTTKRHFRQPAGKHSGDCSNLDISLRRWWRPNTAEKENKWLTYIHRETKNVFPKDTTLSMYYGCINKQILANHLVTGDNL